MATPTSRNPTPAYDLEDRTVLYGDKELYARIADTASEEGARRKVEEFDVPIRSGKAWTLKPAQICRLSTPHGPQVGDLNIWSLRNRDPRGAPERLWAARTRQLHASHVSIGDRLWSNLPWLRPLVTIVGDSLGGERYGVESVGGKRTGVDEVGGRVHDLLGSRCDPYVNKLLSGNDYNNHCHSNLTRAILPFGLQESDVHDVLNVFQVTGLNADGKYFMEPSPATPSSSIEFFAETSLLMALSTCPGGDLSVYGWGADAQERMLATCRPLRVEIFEIEEGVREKVLEGWTEPQGVGYMGNHGL